MSHPHENPNAATEREREKPLTVSRIDPEDRESIAAYYGFEVAQGFSTFPPEVTFEKMVDHRQSQMRSGKLQAAIAREGSEIAATTVVVLESGPMGKTIRKDEAWAAGTVVKQGLRSHGIGERMAAIQDGIARDSGKHFIITAVNADNFPSMRLRLKVGYQLDGIDKDDAGYLFRKDLTREPSVIRASVNDVLAGRLREAKGEFTESSDAMVMIDPADSALVKEALKAGYRGVHLLRPEEFPDKAPIIKPYLVFSRITEETQE